MCLTIITHLMVCDARPVMRHPHDPTTHVVDPFTVPPNACCATTPPDADEGSRCPIHGCCQITERSFPCDCGGLVTYHRYAPAKTPSAYTIETAETPSRGVWRELQSLDDISPGPAAAAGEGEPAPSDELRIARRGFEHAIAQLGPMARALTAASRQKDLREQNRKNGAPYDEQVRAAHQELERLAVLAREVQATYYTWMRVNERFERLAYGKTVAVETAA